MDIPFIGRDRELQELSQLQERNVANLVAVTALAGWESMIALLFENLVLNNEFRVKAITQYSSTI